MKCVGLHVSWPSVAGVSLALVKSESVSRLEMRSSSACTSLRPSLEPVEGDHPFTNKSNSAKKIKNQSEYYSKSQS